MTKDTSKVVVNELKRRGVLVEIVAEKPCMVLRYFFKDSWHLLHSTLPDTTSAVGRITCNEKLLAAAVAAAWSIPIPTTISFTTMDIALSFMHGQDSIVVKPADAAHGNGVTVGVDSEESLQRALDVAAAATSADGTILLQQKVSGSDLRILVVGGRFVAATRRIPASVIGDGIHTIRQLIERENNSDPEHNQNDSLISLEASERFLGAKLDSDVPAAGEEVTVVGIANVGAGGRAVDYTDKVPAEIIAAAETFARTVKVVACGVDFIWDEAADKFYFIEGNACPGFCLHIEPAEGESRPVDRHFVDILLGETTPTWQTNQDGTA